MNWSRLNDGLRPTVDGGVVFLGVGDTCPLGVLRGFRRLCLRRSSHERNQAIPHDFLDGFFGRAVEGEAIDNRLDDDATTDPACSGYS